MISDDVAIELVALLEAFGGHLGLQRRCRSSAAPLAALDSNAGQPIRLEPKLAENLLDLAMQGDIMGITALTDTTLAEGLELTCEHLRGLAAGYDVRAIRQVLCDKQPEIATPRLETFRCQPYTSNCETMRLR